MPIQRRVWKIVVADDHPLIREGIQAVIAKHRDYELVAAVDSGNALLQLLREQIVDIAIVDISMPGIPGLDVIRSLREAHPDLKILVLSMHPPQLYAARCFRLGVWGYLCKSSAIDQLCTALEMLANGQRFISPEVQQILLEEQLKSEPHTGLSDREYEIFLRLAQGESTGEIAVALGLSVKTVSTYRRRILDKLGLQTNAELMAYARSHHLVFPTE